MSILWYFLFPLVFLNFNFKKASIREQIVRYVFGFVYAFIAFYLVNVDRSLSFVLSNLKWIAIFQLIFTVVAGLEMRGNTLVTRHGYKMKWPAIVFTALFLGSVFYSSMPQIYGGTKKLYNMAGVKESNEQSPSINTENIIIIPPETAYYQMQTLIGSLPNPSLYEIGQLSLTQTKEGAYYVAPIDIDSSFRAFLNKELPGIAYVSAERLEDAKLIEIPHSYGESLVLDHNIYRKLREYKPSSILMNADVELDDDLTPYYVGTYGSYKYGRKGLVPEGVVLYNLKTGEIKEYPKDQVPTWVDQIYTTEIAEQYNIYYGKYKNGFLNSIIGKKDVQIPTYWNSGVELPGLSIESNQVVPVVGSDGQMYFFTDHTNTNADSTTMTGYTLMNTRTGETIYYKTPSLLNGQGAMNSIEKLLGAEKANWATAQPILYNIYGIDTWIVPVINKTDGSFVKLGLVTAKSKYSIVADNKLDLLEAFKKAIADGTVNNGADVKVGNDLELQEVTVEGKLVRINQSVEDGSSVFYLKLDTVPDKIFMVNKNVDADVVLARDGDTVKIKYIDMEQQEIIPVIEFTLSI
ncbi:hypothetical protein N3C_2372 [Clostridium sp. N3C]|uniref:hypothetical protein n=1 Tax=Clostridium sp. N3C TaxID=1776758 RepID=UPI00092E1B1D|nr:hypothetical protein [Clostridium sp. N3C]SCN25556.1 hypothetical protein N3C_2372 [Clostridium sp. N3C]